MTYYNPIVLGIDDNNNSVPIKVNSDGSLTTITYSEASNIGTNSNTTPILNGATYTGTYELNSYNDVMVSCKTDQSGILYFDFSNDNVNTDTFPSNGFTVTANIHEFHIAIKGSRYFRVRFTNTSGVDQTYLRLYTYYGEFRQPNAPLNQSISDDSDSMIVRSVNVGSNPINSYVNQKTDGYRLYETTPLLAGTNFNSGIMDLDGYTQIENQIYANQAGTLVGQWYADSGGTILIRTFTRPYSSLTLDYFSAPVFGRYLRYTYTNGGVDQTEFLLGLRFLTKSISGQLLGIEDFIAPNMSLNLARSVIAGKTLAGSYINAGITNSGELFTNTLASNRQTRALYTSGSITTTSYALLVDLSAEQFTKFFSIDNINISIRFTTNNSDANIKLGVIRRIDGTDADISWLISTPFSSANANTYINMINNFQPSSVKFESVGGSLVGAYTNDVSTSLASINTGITLPSARGTTITPAVGDCVIMFEHTGNNFSSIVSAIYHTD